MIEYTVKVHADGDKVWFLNDKRHREDGPAIEYTNGTKAWYLNGQRHREDGPAIEYADGYKAWYLSAQRHREDGPAIEYADGTKSWYLNGKCLTEEEHATATAKPDNANVTWYTAIYFEKDQLRIFKRLLKNNHLSVTEAREMVSIMKQVCKVV